MYRLSTIAILAVLASPVSAQSLPDWVDAEGRIALGYSDRIPGAEAFLVGDVTFRFSPDLFGAIGFELGMFGRADTLDTPHETYGALTLDVGTNGRLSFGVPRPAYDGFAVPALDASFPSLGIDRTATTRSAATSGAMFAFWLPYGVGFTNETDNLRYGASVHHANNADRTIASLGAATEVGDWQLSGAIEVVWGGVSTDVSGKVQAKTQLGPVTGGVGFYAPGATGASDTLELFASVDPMDRVTLSGVVQVPTDGTADPTAGISARYGFSNSGGVSLGVATDAGSDPVVNAFVDFRF